MAKLTKTQKYKKIESLARKHGKVVAVFEDFDGPMYGSDERFIRRRKIMKDGDAFVSYFGHNSRKWSKYSMSCFILHLRSPSLEETMEEMFKHDKGELTPIKIIVGKKVIKL